MSHFLFHPFGCLHTASSLSNVRYTPVDAGGLEVIEDEEAGKTTTVLHQGADKFGSWEGKKPPTFGLVFNSKETPLKRVIRLQRGTSPASFNPYEAVWRVAQEGKKSYFCGTFNFDDLGKCGSKPAKVPFYTVGNIAVNKR